MLVSLRWRVVAGAAVLGCCAAIVVLVRLFTGSAEQSAGTVDVESYWAEAIGQYGMEPVFPPEEDFAVGDLFVQIVSDDDPDPNAHNRVTERSAFRATAVKLDHLDVREDLEALYSTVPYFGEAPTSAAAAAAGPNGSGSDLFRRARQALPIAAFPSISQTAARQGSGGLAGVGWGSFAYGEDSQSRRRLELPTIETYGLPSVVAQRKLETYCDKHPEVCSEEGARRHLTTLVGDRARARYVDRQLNSQYAIQIRIFLVNRVYLARAIVSQDDLGHNESGSVRVSPGGAQAAGADRSGQAGDGGNASGDLQQRVVALERQLAARATQQAVGGTLGSASSREIALNRSFARPVAVGYRYVEYVRPRPQ